MYAVREGVYAGREGCRYTLQHTATHGNTRQHTNTIYQLHMIGHVCSKREGVYAEWKGCRDTLQHTATHCSTPQHTATHGNAQIPSTSHTWKGMYAVRERACMQKKRATVLNVSRRVCCTVVSLLSGPRVCGALAATVLNEDNTDAWPYGHELYHIRQTK